ncbi:MAG: phosphate ABC transporter permease subunit PstC [bacterium]|nr:phosphate ABC transporter permease subunit PstC [bacterium]MDD5353648.1 phosphate ABC transporter permease subunit PstC [bacterium]
MTIKKNKKEKLLEILFLFFAFLSNILLVGIIIILFKESLPLFKEIKVLDFLLGRHWYPTYDPPEFGILPLILGSLWVTIGSLLVAVPLGLGAAIYISEIASTNLKEILKPAVEVLAGIPSVVLGFFGMVVIAPFLQNVFKLPTGLNALNASILLGIMAIPTITSISEDCISAVPRGFKEASYALGANRWETMIKVTVPAAFSGISSAVILGMGRAIGETMTVLMVAGGAAIIPHSFLQPVRTMTATIAAEMGETAIGSDHYFALFGIAVVLFILTLIFNIIADLVAQRFRKRIV